MSHAGLAETAFHFAAEFGVGQSTQLEWMLTMLLDMDEVPPAP
jgi:hypothetical protein